VCFTFFNLFYDFSIVFWNCSDSVVYFVFLLYFGTVLTVVYFVFLLYFGTVLTVVYFVFHFFSIITILFGLFIVCICFCSFVFICCLDVCLTILRGRRRRDRMVVGFTTTCAISAYHL
jgi:hypothetical protein